MECMRLCGGKSKLCGRVEVLVNFIRFMLIIYQGQCLGFSYG